MSPVARTPLFVPAIAAVGALVSTRDLRPLSGLGVGLVVVVVTPGCGDG
jgi:hypothetical protein